MRIILTGEVPAKKQGVRHSGKSVKVWTDQRIEEAQEHPYKHGLNKQPRALWCFSNNYFNAHQITQKGKQTINI